MTQTIFFYDLETSGLNPRESRIMQFAGVRTDMGLKQIGEPINVLVKLNDDTLPDPDAALVTGITPQQTLADGMTEAEFAKMLNDDVFTPDTISVGYNNIRFDDEFIRHLFWRNFYDPYEWAWKDGKSRWDFLDVVRMTRALRPDGIEWPVDDRGICSNRLELITFVNKIAHVDSHDALCDVNALIEVARMIKAKQPKLYEYLLKMREPSAIKKLVNLDEKQPFVYVSGRYDSEFNKATVAFPLSSSNNGKILVYDLRYDPVQFLQMDQKELAKKVFATWEERHTEGFVRLPVKEFQYNRAPAVAPLSVLDQEGGWEKVGLTKDNVDKHLEALVNEPGFAEKLRSIFENRQEFKKSPDPEAQLYDGFVPDKDKIRIEKVRSSDANDLADFHPNFDDERLSPLLLHYKARNYPNSLSEDETVLWEKWRTSRINAKLPKFAERLQMLANVIKDENKLYVLEELHLWAESIAPSD